MTEQQDVAQRKTLPLQLTRKADGIVKRLPKDEVVKALLFRAKKDFAMEFLMHGTLNEKAPSALQIVSTLYNGFEYKYGTENAKETMILPANPEMIEEIANGVPETEINLPVAKKSAKEVVRSTLIETAKRALGNGFSIEDVKSFMNLTDEELSQLQ